MYEENAKAFLVHVDPRRSRDRTHFGAGAYLLVDRRLASLLARPGYLPSLSSYIVRYVPLFRFVTRCKKLICIDLLLLEVTSYLYI
jgi:hypothetical protein